MKRLVLASSSPRRKELLELHKFDFIIDFQEIEEVLDESLALPLRLEKLAYQKAAPIALKYCYWSRYYGMFRKSDAGKSC